jgi:glucans biosynthesis protein
MMENNDALGGEQILPINAMNQLTDMRLRNLRQAPRCGARNRAGEPCRCPAIRGRRRCRLHGGLSPGAPRGGGNGNFRHGDFTREAIQHRKWLRALLAEALCLDGNR